jgi:two-component system cell cycle sensor histidine kinase/response regulator CckA
MAALVEAERPAVIRILDVEDLASDHDLLVHHLRKSGLNFSCRRVDSRESLAAALESDEWDLVTSDYKLETFNGLEALAMVRTRDADLPFLMLSGSIGEELAAQAMRLGASDYLSKENLSRLVPAIERELREAKMRREKRRVEAALAMKERELIHSQRLDALGRLAGGVAHDFNNILSVILFSTDSIGASGQFTKKVEEIHQAVERGTSLVKQLLAFGKRGVLSEPEAADLNDVVSRMAPMLQRLVSRKISLEFRAGAGLPQIGFFSSQVEQVLLNLVVNARDAIAESGRVFITTSRERRATPRGERDHCVLEVSDTGCGMDNETLRRIFEPFFSTKEAGKGTGLGLSTVSGIMERGNGTIEVRSEPGKGTTFRLLFPVLEASREEPVPRGSAERRATRAAGTKVLLVKRNALSGQALAAALNEAGCITVYAISGEVASLILEEEMFRPDVLIVDLAILTAPGFQLARIAARDYGILHAILVTDDGIDVEIPARIGTMEVSRLTRPLSPEKVLARLEEIVSNAGE